MKRLKKICLSILLGGAFLGLLIALFAKPKENTEVSNKPIADQGVTESKNPQKSTAPTASPEEQQDKVYAIGDTSSLIDWEITVTDMDMPESISDNDYMAFKPESGNKYIRAYVSVTNKAKTADTFLPIIGVGKNVSAKLLYGDGYEFSSSNMLGYKNELHDSHLNPLASVDKEIAFEVPDAIASESDELILQFSVGRDTVSYKIR